MTFAEFATVIKPTNAEALRDNAVHSLGCRFSVVVTRWC